MEGRDVRSDVPLALRALRYWPLLLVIALLAAAAAVVYNEAEPRDYRAEAQILVTPIAADEQIFLTVPALRQTGDTPRLVQTAAAVVDSHRARRRTEAQLGEVADGASIDVQAKGASNLIAISATAPDARPAARVANAYARNTLAVRSEQLAPQLDASIRRTQRQLARVRNSTTDYALNLRNRLDLLRATRQAGGDPTLSLSQTADVPSEREGPPPWLLVVAALVAGLALGFGLLLFLVAIRPQKPASA